MGATYDEKGVNFAVFSSGAQRIELCLFDDTGEHETRRIDLPARTGDIWHVFVEGLPNRTLYNYRADGPYDPAGTGHRFNPHKTLIDPYAEVATMRRAKP